MAFKFFIRKARNGGTIEKGQDWQGESVEENLALCEYEGCRHIFEDYFPKDSMILEAGCGLGRWVISFARQGYRIIGCDIDHKALVDAKCYDPSLSLIRADIGDLPFKDDCFDAIISLGVIEHFENGPHRPLEEKGRVLKPSGVLFVAVPYNSTFRRVIVNHFISLKLLFLRALGYEMVFTEYRYSKTELTDLLEHMGFDVISSYPEMLVPPKHIGAYIDYIHLTGIVPKNKFEVPKPVSIIANLIKSISPWLISGMVLCIARTKTYK